MRKLFSLTILIPLLLGSCEKKSGEISTWEPVTKQYTISSGMWEGSDGSFNHSIDMPSLTSEWVRKGSPEAYFFDPDDNEYQALPYTFQDASIAVFWSEKTARIALNFDNTNIQPSDLELLNFQLQYFRRVNKEVTVDKR